MTRHDFIHFLILSIIIVWAFVLGRWTVDVPEPSQPDTIEVLVPVPMEGCEVTYGPYPAKEGWVAYGVICPEGEG